MSDFYIFLQEDKGFTEDDIENLSKAELDKYLKEYVELERKRLDNQKIKKL